MKTIKEEKIDLGNNESAVKAGVYFENGAYNWLTFTKSGTCKKLSTAMQKAGF